MTENKTRGTRSGSAIYNGAQFLVEPKDVTQQQYTIQRQQNEPCY